MANNDKGKTLKNLATVFNDTFDSGFAKNPDFNFLKKNKSAPDITRSIQDNMEKIVGLYALQNTRGNKVDTSKQSMLENMFMTKWNQFLRDTDKDNQNKEIRFSLWREMLALSTNSILVGKAIGMYQDEIVQFSSGKEALIIESKNKDISKRLYDLFYNRLNITKVIRDIVRGLCIYGNYASVIGIEDNAVVSLTGLNIHNFHSRIEFSAMDIKQELNDNQTMLSKFSTQDDKIKNMLEFMTASEGDLTDYFKTHLIGYEFNDMVIPAWRLLHFRIADPSSPLYPFGSPLFLSCLNSYLQYESGLTLNLLAREYKFPIDKYNITMPNSMSASEKMAKATQFYNQFKKIGGQHGRKEDRGIGEEIITIQDLFEYDQIVPDIEISDIDDLELLREDIMLGTLVPKTLLDGSGNFWGASGVSLIEQSKPFANKIYTLQSVILEQLTYLAKLDIYLSSDIALEEIDFTLSMIFPAPQSDSDLVSSHNDLVDLSNNVLDSLGDYLDGNGANSLPPEVITDVYKTLLPFNDDWVEDLTKKVLKNKEKLSESMSGDERASFRKLQERTSKSYYSLNESAKKKVIDDIIYTEKNKTLVETYDPHKKRHVMSSRCNNNQFSLHMYDSLVRQGIDSDAESRKKLQEILRGNSMYKK